MRIIELIEKKQHKGKLSQEELLFLANGAADGSIPDYQLSAFLMAVWFNGLDDKETLWLTMAMANSGEMADLSGISGLKADKHSTGGVGDKTTLIVAPIVAACGLKVAKMSGRGLGFTGGTIDKLESIPGLSTAIPAEKFKNIVNEIGLCVAGQSTDLAPADKKLYALRDVTSTVDCIPLIAASVMSKKLAGGADIIVLDVKCGSGAFMKTPEQAKILAETMVRIGKGAGRSIVALITDMDTPLGNNIGNLLEVEEAVRLLHGQGDKNLKELCVQLAAQMLVCAGKSQQEAVKSVEGAIHSGAAFERLCAMVKAQGGNDEWIRDTLKMKQASYKLEIKAPFDGYIIHTDSMLAGKAAMLLGAGRETKNDTIDPTAGIVLSAKTRDAVKIGQTIATLYTCDENRLPEASAIFEKAVVYGLTQPEQKPLILGVIC